MSGTPRELEQRIEDANRRALRVAAVGLLALVVATVATLVFTLRTLEAVEDATGEAATERSAARIVRLIDELRCDRREDLETLVAVLLADTDGPAPEVSIEWPDGDAHTCPTDRRS